MKPVQLNIIIKCNAFIKFYVKHIKNMKNGFMCYKNFFIKKWFTFNKYEHELVERHCAVIGYHFCRLHTPQVDFPKVLFAGQTCQCSISQIRVLSH